MLPRLDDYFMCSERAHFIVDSFGDPRGIILHTVERIRMRDDADLPRAFRRPRQDTVGLFDYTGIKRAR